MQNAIFFLAPQNILTYEMNNTQEQTKKNIFRKHNVLLAGSKCLIKNKTKKTQKQKTQNNTKECIFLSLFAIQLKTLVVFSYQPTDISGSVW
jgi:hypothetical protein